MYADGKVSLLRIFRKEEIVSMVAYQFMFTSQITGKHILSIEICLYFQMAAHMKRVTEAMALIDCTPDTFFSRRNLCTRDSFALMKKDRSLENVRFFVSIAFHDRRFW